MQEWIAIFSCALLAICALFAAGCQGRSQSTSEAPESAPAEELHQPEQTHGGTRGQTPSYQAIEVTQAGTISGQVTWSGPPFPTPSLEVRTHRELCGTTQPSPALVLGPQGGVADTVVSIDLIQAGRELAEPALPTTVRRESCRFSPHVVAVMEGWQVRFENRDPILSNVHGRFNRYTWVNVGLPEAGASETVEVPRAGVSKLTNAASGPWMHAWVHSFEHPYFAVTGEDGRFELTEVPHGEYILRVWHEGFQVVGTRGGRPHYSNPIVLTRSVSVVSDQVTSVDFEINNQAAENAGSQGDANDTPTPPPSASEAQGSQSSGTQGSGTRGSGTQGSGTRAAQAH